MIRPVALIVSALVSTLVFISARKRKSNSWIALAWGISTFFLPFVVLPIYLVTVVIRKDRTTHSVRRRFRFALPALYLLALLAFITLSIYQDRNSVDAHLARAVQARLRGDGNTAIVEYERALQIEDNAHIHKLLGIQLLESGRRNEALREFQLAKTGGEPDDMLDFQLAGLLENSGKANEAQEHYRQFSQSRTCSEPPVDPACDIAREKSKDHK